MISSILILVFSAALFLFYLQAACERMLRRPFQDPLPDPIVEANRLEFPLVRRALKEVNTPVDCGHLRLHLKQDCVTLIYLLKHAANHGRLSSAERLLALYFRALSGVATLGGRPVLVKMTAVLEYFANVLGERVKGARFAGLTC